MDCAVTPSARKRAGRTCAAFSSRAISTLLPALGSALVILLSGCEGRLQGGAASPFAQADTPRQSAPATAAAAAVAAAYEPAAIAGPTRLAAPAPAFDPRSATPPLVAPIPLRGPLTEDLVYEGLLDGPATQALVQALEAASPETAEPAQSQQR